MVGVRVALVLLSASVLSVSAQQPKTECGVCDRSVENYTNDLIMTLVKLIHQIVVIKTGRVVK